MRESEIYVFRSIIFLPHSELFYVVYTAILIFIRVRHSLAAYSSAGWKNRENKVTSLEADVMTMATSSSIFHAKLHYTLPIHLQLFQLISLLFHIFHTFCMLSLSRVRSLCSVGIVLAKRRRLIARPI